MTTDHREELLRKIAELEKDELYVKGLSELIADAARRALQEPDAATAIRKLREVLDEV